MWYVIQTKTGNEQDLKLLFEATIDKEICNRCFVPLFEEVKRSGGKCRISFRRMFPGYIFAETDKPEELFDRLRGIPEFTKILGTVEDDGSKIFIPIGPEDEDFLQTLFEDGLMHVSYIHMGKNGRIDRIAGPLSKYKNHITKLELRHRMAIVEADMFGKRRRVKFGLWTDEDPFLPDVKKYLSEYENENESTGGDVLGRGAEVDLGIHEGDRVMDETGIYGDQVFVVEKVDTQRRVVISQFEMFGTTARIELNADDVKVV